MGLRRWFQFISHYVVNAWFVAVMAMGVIATTTATTTAAQSPPHALGEFDSAPVFITGADDLSVTEGSTDVGQVRAIDSENDSISYRIGVGEAGGADRTLFNINSINGLLRFNTAPDFEDDRSLAGTTIYEVTIIASSTRDSTGTTRRAERTFNVSVLDLDTTPIFLTTRTTFDVFEGEAASTLATFSTDRQVSYTLSGPNAGLFSITLGGELSFISAPVFVAGGNNIRRLLVIATSRHAAADRASLAVIVNIINDRPPEFTVDADAFSIDEGRRAVGEVRAIDPDGSAVTYQIPSGAFGGADGHLFYLISPNRPSLLFRNAPDFEDHQSANDSDTYSVRILATSTTPPGTAQTTARVFNIEVLDVDSAPTFVGGTNRTFVVLEGVTLVDSVRTEEAARWTFSGSDSGLFNFLTFGTIGFITFKSPSQLDPDGDNSRELEIIATSLDAARDRSTLDVMVRILEDMPPTFTTNEDELSVPEGERVIGEIVTSEPNQDRVFIRIVGGEDSDLFGVTYRNQLYFINARDFENQNSASGDDDLYEVEIEARSRSGNNNRLTTTRTFQVEVTDTDRLPTFLSCTAVCTRNIRESSLFVDNFATDIPVFYTLSGTDAAAFRIASNGDLSFNQRQNFSPSASWSVTISATSQHVAADTAFVQVLVTLFDDHAPEFQTNVDAFSINEGDRLVGYVRATDSNNAEPVRYSISPGSPAPDNNLFEVTPDGELSFIQAPDFESDDSADGDDTYSVRVVAESIGDSGQSRRTGRTFEIPVRDLDQVPTLVAAPTDYDRLEGTSLVTAFRVIDANVSWSLAGTDATEFQINASGELSFVAPAGYEEGGDNERELTVIATNNAPSRDAVQLDVMISIEQDVPPVFSTAEDDLSVPEGQTWIGRVSASDSNHPTYASRITYAISGGADAVRFVIGLVSGELSLSAPADFEAPASTADSNTYEVRVTASSVSLENAPRTTDLTLNIVILDAEETPLFVGGTSALRTVTTLAGQTEVDRFAASVEQGGVNYVLTGDDARDFAIDTRGVLAFRAPPVFDVAGGGANMRSLNIVATSVADTTLSATLAVMVSIEADTPPVFASPDLNISVSEGTSIVHRLNATDANSANHPTIVSYTITGGANADLFRIDENTQYLSFIAAPDFEIPLRDAAGNTYRVRVTATSSTRGLAEQTANQNITITVTDLDGAPEFVLGAGPIDRTLIAGATSVGFFTAGSSTIYSIAGTDDGGAFGISNAGELAFLVPAPFNAGGVNTYNLNIIATDAGSSADSSRLAVTINIVENRPPEIAAATLSIPEGLARITTIVASDPDNATFPTRLSYAVTGGADAALFSIDPDLGQLNFVTARDFEDDTSASGNNVYELTVTVTGTVTSGAGSGVASSASRSFEVAVENVGMAPNFIDQGDSATFDVVEGTRFIATLSVGESVNFELVGDDAAFFEIQSDGDLFFRFGAAAKDDGSTQYEFDVLARSPAVSMDNSSVRVTVNVMVDEPPEFMTAEDALSVDEGVTLVGSVEAEDPNEDSDVSYGLAGGADEILFSIDATSGQLSFVNARDFEDDDSVAGTDIYEVTVRATSTTNPPPDGGAGSGMPLSSERTFMITLNDVDDEPMLLAAESAFSALAGTTDTVAVFEASVGVDWSLGGEDEAAFSITSDGELSFVSPPPFVIDGDNIRILDVIATNQSATADSTIWPVIITIVRDFPPVWTTPADVLSIEEGQTEVGQVVASDANNPLHPTSITYAITGGADELLFQISSATGVLSFRVAPDFEDGSSAAGSDEYEVEVTASSQTQNAMTRTAARLFIVQVGNVGGEPDFINAQSEYEVLEGVTRVTTFNLSAAVNFALVGSDATSFTISAEGALDFVSTPTFTVGGDNEYAITLVATSSGGAGDSTSLPVQIEVIRDEPPVFVSPETALFIYEGGTVVALLTVTDANNPERTTNINYTVSGGADSALFEIDAGTGALSFITAPDFEINDSLAGTDEYEVEVTVSSTTLPAPAQTINRTYSVTVRDIDAAPRFATVAPTGSINVLEGTTEVATFELDSPVTYSLTGTDAATFSITEAGEVTFNTPPDFTAGGTNSFSLSIIATIRHPALDTNSRDVSINVVEDAPPVWVTAADSLTMNEGEVLVGVLMATDANVPDIDTTFSYAITGGADAALFVIDEPSGTLSFATAPDFENDDGAGGSDVYAVEVTVSSTSGTAEAMRVMRQFDVMVENVDEQPVFELAPARIEVLEGTQAVMTYSAVSETGAVSYNLEAVGAGSGGGDIADLTIDSASGELRFVSPALFRNIAANNSFSLMVVATANLDTAQRTQVALEVVVVEDVPPAWVSADDFSMNEGETLAGYVQASDANANTFTTNVRYAVTGGADAARFVIDALTGELRFTAAPDFEDDASAEGTDVYTLNITATAITVATNRRQRIVRPHRVTVLDVATTPTFAGDRLPGIMRIAILEGVTTIETLFTDTAVNYEVAPAYTGSFSINSISGALTFITAPVFVPGTANEMRVDIIATSINQAADRALFPLIIDIIDDEPPDFSAAAKNYSLEEGSLLVGNIVAREANGDLIIFALDTGMPDHVLFRIDPEAGRLSFRTAPDFELPRSAESSNIYRLRVVARSVSLPNPPQSSLLDIEIEVTDDIINVPEFATSVNTFIGVLEGTTQVGTFRAALPDPNTAIVYSLSGRDVAFFFVGGVSGELSFIETPVFQPLGRNTFQIDFNATSRAPSADITSLELRISVVDDVPPVFRDRLLPPVMESELMAATIVATDTNPNSPVRYALSGGADRTFFAIDEQSGMLSFRTPPDFDAPADLESVDPIIDAAANNEYVVSITATSATSPNPPQQETITHVVTVVEARRRPRFEQLEIQASEGGINAGTLRLLDPEAPVIAMRITGGADAEMFSIGLTSPPEPNARLLRFDRAPDFENPLDLVSPVSDDGGTADNPTPIDRANNNIYVVRVTADFADGENLTSDVLVQVTNVAEGRSFVGPTRFRHPENASIVTFLRLIGIDDGETINNPGLQIAGGADAALFEVDDSTGALSFITAPNFEMPPRNEDGDNTFDVQVTASAAPVIDLVVDVVNLDEAPVLAGPFSFDVNESGLLPVHTFTAEDEDGDLLSYQISGADSGLFEMGVISGELAFRTVPDYEQPDDANRDNVYELVVIAAAATQEPKSDRQRVLVTVQDVREALVFADRDFQVATGQTQIGRLEVEPGQVRPETISFSLAGGPDLLRFGINGAQLMFTTAPDFANPLDANGDNLYQVILQANSTLNGETITDRSTVRVRVNPAVAENSVTLDGFALLDAVRISGGADAEFFSLTNGRLAFITAPDFENPRDRLSITPPDAAGNNHYVVTTINQGGASFTHIISVTDQTNEASEAGTDQLVSVGDTVILQGQENGEPNTSYSFTQIGGQSVVLTNIGSRGARFFVSADAADELFVFRFSVLSSDGTRSDDDVRIQVRPAPFVVSQSLSLSEGLAPETLLGEPFQAQNFATTAIGQNVVLTGFWSITSGNDDELFVVNREAGRVTLAKALDFEQRNSHAITLQYTQNGISGSGMLNISVTNRNEPPTVNLGDDRRVPVAVEVVLSAQASDPEQAANDLTYNWIQLEGPPVMLEDITTTAARFTPDRALGGELLVFRLTVTDAGGLKDQSTILVEISDDPVDEGVLEPGEAMVMEDAVLGALVGSPLATTGFLVGTGVWRIVSGNEANLFDINSASGQVRLQGLLDFEAEPAHSLEISYQLGLLRGIGMLAITLEDVDEMPTADAAGEERVVTSGSLVSLNATLSSDPEDLMELTYMWEQFGGIPVELDDPESATPTFTAPVVTAAAPLILSFRLTVTDSGDLTDTIVQDIRVVNSDVSPIITTNRLSIFENQKEVGLIEAVDADRDPITYSLGPGGDEALFELSEEGDLSFRSAPDFEAPSGTGDGGTEDNIYLLNIIATSVRDGGRSQAAARAVFIEVRNDTDEAPMFSLEEVEFNVTEGDTEPFVRLTASDPEGNNLNFIIQAGADRGQFDLGRINGALSFRSPPDFETPADLASDNPVDPAGDNTYVVVVIATATGVNGEAQSDTLSLRVRVTDNPNESLASGEFEVSPDALVGDAIGTPLALDGSFTGPGSWSIVTVTRTDPDTFMLIDLRTENLFSIDTASGQLSVDTGADTSFAARYAVGIRIESGDGEYLAGVANIDVSPDPTPGVVSLSDTTPSVNLAVDASLTETGTTLNLEWRWQVLEDGRWSNLANATTPQFVPLTPQGSRSIRAVATYAEDGVRRRVNSEASEPVGTDFDVRREIIEASLAVIGRSLSEDALTVIGRRMTGQGRNVLNVGSVSLSPGASGDDYANSALGWMERFSSLAVARQNNQNWSWRDGTSFSRRLGAGQQHLDGDDGEGGANSDAGVPKWSIWGEASRRTFSGRPTPLVSSMNGDTESVWLGLDRYINSYGLAGLAIQYSESELGFRSETEGDGSLTSSLTTFYPYLHYSPLNGVYLWGIAGYGIGHINYLSGASGNTSQRASADFLLLSGGGRFDLLGIGYGRTLFAIKADGLYSALKNQASGALVPAARGEFGRFRVGFGVDFDWEINSGDSLLVSTIDLSARLDRGDAERGLGLELNADTTWRHLSSGLALVVHVNKLIAHEQGALDQTGFGFGISVDAGKLGEGLALSFTPTFGYQSVTSALSDIGSAERLGGDGSFSGSTNASSLHSHISSRQSRMKLKASYGILAGQLRLVPEVEVSSHNGIGNGSGSPQVSVVLKLDWIYK